MRGPGGVVVGFDKTVHLLTVFSVIPCMGRRVSTREPFTGVPLQAALCETLPTLLRRCFSVYILCVFANAHVTHVVYMVMYSVVFDF